MPNRLMMRCITGVHMFWYRLSGGRIGGQFGRMKVLLLTTKGRKSGRPWTTPLTYMEDGGDIVIIASNGGSDRHPAWYLNLRAEPAATIEVRDGEMQVRAEEASPEERARLWPRIVKIAPNYGGYQKRTKREIPVVSLRRTTPVRLET